MKRKVYIAAPFFNPVQLGIVMDLEGLCELEDVEYYSPRLHSGSHQLTAKMRKEYSCWSVVLQSNIDAINGCDAMLAVFEYAMPNDTVLISARHSMPDAYSDNEPMHHYHKLKEFELPDNGVVFECGYAYAKGIPIAGFHRTLHPKDMNLMLTHTCVGMLVGYGDVSEWLGTPTPLASTIDRDAPWKFNWEYAKTPTSEVI